MTDRSPSQRRVMRELTAEESLELLSSVPLGRVVFTDQALPAIRPVNHLVDDGQVVIRTHPGAAVLTAAVQKAVVAYQADLIDPVERIGWSVVVTGVARVVSREAAVSYRERLQPWVEPPSRDRVISISADLVTGFRLDREPVT
jgi:nitroimidazol reductase NimA-like FMN-containing flavoprotein (pyridoxamine 5'-phosphate oxidase superfamily)